jgi:hypothetical protein
MRVLAAAMVAPLAWPLATGRVFGGPDLPNFNLPIRYLYREALRAGDSFLWTPALFSGMYIFGDGQAGMAHPVHWLLYRFLPLGTAFGIEILTSYVVALAGARALLRRLGVAPAAAWLGAIVFAFSGFNLLHLVHMNAVAIVAHLPWVLVATHALMTNQSARRRALAFGGLSLLIGSQLLLGYPHYVWMTLVADAALVVGLVVGGAPMSRAIVAAAAVVVGVLVGGAQLLPTWDMLHTSIRADPSLEFRLTGSLSPWNLLQLWSPYVFAHRIYASAEEFLVNEFGLYDGAFCTLAVFWVALRWRDLERRRLAAGLLALAALGLVLALGRFGGLYVLLAQLPILNTLRVPARHIVLVHLALAGLAAIVFEDLVAIGRRGQTVEWRRLGLLAVPVVLSVATSVAGVALAGTPWAVAHFLMFSGPARAAFGTFLMGGAAALLVMASRGVRGATIALAVFVAADLGAWGYGYVFQAPVQTVEAIAAGANAPPGARAGEYVTPPANLFQANVLVLRGLRLSAGYAGLIPASVLDPYDEMTARVGGVSWRLADGAWARVSDTMPRARLVADARVSRNIVQDLRTIDIGTVALVDAPIDLAPGPPGDARVLVDRPGRIVVHTEATASRLLVLTERFHAGWRATTGDRAWPMRRADGDYLACVVDAGAHDVTLLFEPVSARRGVIVTIVGLVLVAAVVALAQIGVKPESDPV